MIEPSTKSIIKILIPIVPKLYVSKEEYDRIEKSLAFNNKKELEILSNYYPEINVKTAIETLQLEE